MKGTWLDHFLGVSDFAGVMHNNAYPNEILPDGYASSSQLGEQCISCFPDEFNMP